MCNCSVWLVVQMHMVYVACFISHVFDARKDIWMVYVIGCMYVNVYVPFMYVYVCLCMCMCLCMCVM